MERDNNREWLSQFQRTEKKIFSLQGDKTYKFKSITVILSERWTNTHLNEILWDSNLQKHNDDFMIDQKLHFTVQQ